MRSIIPHVVIVEVEDEKVSKTGFHKLAKTELLNVTAALITWGQTT